MAIPRTIPKMICLVLALMFVLACGASIAQEPVKVKEIKVTGNDNINTDAIINVTKMKVGDDFTEAAMEADRSAIMEMGYFSAVTGRKEETAGGINVVFEVTEYPKITDIVIQGSDPIKPEVILNLMKTKPGQVLNASVLSQDFGSIQNLYAEEGYIGYVSESDEFINPQTGVLTIPILVNKVETVDIQGNKKTKEYVFLREMKTKPGTYFNARTFREDIIKIYNLDILEEAKPELPEPGSKPGLVKLTTKVVEKKTGQVSLGLGYSSTQKLVGQVRFSESNFRGTGQGLTMLWERGTSTGVGGGQSYELGFFEPWLDSNHTSLSVNLYNKVLYRFSSGVFSSSALSSDKTYSERRKGADLTLSRPMGDRFTVFLGGRFESVDADPDLLLGAGDLARLVQKGDVKSGNVRAVHDTRDIALDPAAGGYDMFSVEVGSVNSTRFEPSADGTAVSSIPFNGGFTKYNIDFRRYLSKGGRKMTPQDKRTTIALRLRGGVASGTLPFFEQFFVGGGETLRGYREDRFWGKNMLLASAELRYPIAQAFTGALFVDYGSAWGADNFFQIGELQQSNSFNGALGGGVGVRIVTPIGHIRLDYGVGKEGGRTHFSMGQTF